MFQGTYYPGGPNQQYPLFAIPPQPLTPSNPDELSQSTSPPVRALSSLLHDNVVLQRFLFDTPAWQDLNTALQEGGGHDGLVGGGSSVGGAKVVPGRVLTQFEYSQEGQFNHDFSEAQPNYLDFPHQFPGPFPGGPPTPPPNTVGQQQQPFSQGGQATKTEPDDNQQGSRGNGGSEDELTPSQARRKAQNRAAQRAFRERKERHVKELEQALASLKESQQETATENERLRNLIQKISTENEILKATAGAPNGGSQAGPGASPEPVVGPMEYNPKDFYSNVLQDHANKTPSHRIVETDDGDRLLAAGATWDYIISHEDYKRGLVDVGDVSDRLKHQARCDGQGPVFSEKSILEAIKLSVASGSDELL